MICCRRRCHCFIKVRESIIIPLSYLAKLYNTWLLVCISLNKNIGLEITAGQSPSPVRIIYDRPNKL